jgi:D-alanyl-D-alanine carboxypeptidase
MISAVRRALLSILLPSVLPAQTPADRGYAEALRYIDAAARELMLEDGTPGMALAVVADGQVLGIRTYGFADVATRTPVTPDTRFLAGSISKAFTAVALLQLQEEGLIDIHRPVTDYLPWFKVRSRYAPITLHHLLTHTAGLPRDRSDLPSSPYTALALRDREVGAPPGERFAYSNIGYQLLSLVIEEVEGRPFGEEIRRRILEPLGMRETVPEVTQAGRLTTATGYQYLYDDRPPVPAEPLVPVAWGEYSAGDANIVSTAPDLARFLLGLLAQGGAGSRRLLQPASFARMVQRTVPAPELGESAFYGYGMILGTEEGDPVLWHSGGMPGFRAMLLGDADERLGVVILMNGPGNPRRLAEYALRSLIAVRRGKTPPPVEVAAPPEVVPHAADYSGVFTDGGERRLSVEATGDRLWLRDGAGRWPLLRDGEADQFILPDTAWARFPVRFGRQEGRVVELIHGGQWFTAPGYTGPRSFPQPGEWAAYTGHYRAQVPYYSNYRVVLRKGDLLLVSPEGLEEPLVPLAGREFRVGRDARSVERVTFADVVSGRALRLNLSGTEYYRTMTP